MSSEAAGDHEDREHASFIRMRAEDTFYGQDRVIHGHPTIFRSAPRRTPRPAAIPGSCPTTISSTWTASA